MNGKESFGLMSLIFTNSEFHEVSVWIMRSNPDIDKNRYRANTCSAVQRLAAASSFTVAPLDRSEGRPEVLRMIWPTDLLGAVYERRVNAWDGLALFRILLVGELRKG